MNSPSIRVCWIALGVWFFLCSCVRAPATPDCGASVVSLFDYSMRAANQGTRGLIAERQAATDAHLVPGAACSREPAIGALTLQNRSLHCTGTLISPRVVLTAAHCVHRINSRSLRFVLGNDSRASSAPSYPVQSVSVHPSYEHGCGGSDLAVVVLQEDVLDVAPLVYAREPLRSTGPKLTYIGYGFGSFDGNQGAGVKRCADLPLDKLDKGWFRSHLGGENVCHGDSGGPALEHVPGGVRVVGVTSWGDVDCTRYTVSTDVGALSAWLDGAVHAAAKLRPNQRVAYDHTVLEMIDPASEGVGEIMDRIEPFPGFPYYSRASDHPSAWPERVLLDRERFSKQVDAFFEQHPIRSIQGETSVELLSSGPENPNDTWRTIAQRYMQLRTLFNSELGGDLEQFGRRVGAAAATDFQELEKLRRFLSQTLPNRLWVLRVRNESPTPAGPLELKFKVAGMVYDSAASISRFAASTATDGTTTIHVESLQRGEVVELRIWYRYLPANARTFPDLRNFELDRTQGIVIDELKVSGARLVPAVALSEDLRKTAYKVYEGLLL